VIVLVASIYCRLSAGAPAGHHSGVKSHVIMSGKGPTLKTGAKRNR